MDGLAFIGAPPLFRPEADEVHVSCTFTWDIPEAKRLTEAWREFYPVVKLGGPAFGSEAGDFEPGRYLAKGFTITTRGCPNDCPWCLVPEREGKVRCLPIREGWIVQDNNLLAAPRAHIARVFDMLRVQSHYASFPGGFEAARFDTWHRDLLLSIGVNNVWFAYDHLCNSYALKRAVDMLRDAGFSRRKLRCYVLIGWKDDQPEWARRRLEGAWDLGMLPFAMGYQPPDRRIERDAAWRGLIHEWTRPAAMFSNHGENVPELAGLLSTLKQQEERGGESPSSPSAQSVDKGGSE